MNCYIHTDKPAIGICKACNKGVCQECSTDMGHGLACKGVHEEMVETYHSIIQRNTKMYQNVGANIIIAPIFYLFMGLVFAGYGYYSSKGVTGLSFVLGVGFIIFSIIHFVRNKATFGATKK